MDSTRPKARILVVDDNANMRKTTALMLQEAGYEVRQAAGGPQALEAVREDTIDVVLTDMRMAPMSGIELVARLRELSPTTQVLVMTAYGSVQNAVEAMRQGAKDYLQKPFNEGELLLRVERAVEQRRLLAEVAVLADEFRKKYGLENIVGKSRALREMLARVVRVAPSDTTVLITGESGTGKELVARAIHANSRRAQRPFVPVNCAALNEELLESELFGHARGAFTGAVHARRGLFEEADGGTFFFDEIAETTPAFQAKLLRAIQEHEIRRVGENAPLRVDVRIVAATNVDLKQAIKEKRFREDLYYRLNVVPIRTPPLRERKEDIPLLVDHFLRRYNERNDTQKVMSQAALDRLMAYDFPGNVRELENLVEQAAALSPKDVIEVDDVQIDVQLPGSPKRRGASAAERAASQAPTAGVRPLSEVVAEAERSAIEAAIAHAGGRLERAAKELGISHTTLWRKMRRHGIKA
ncbi:MAG: sigma-54-dependent Fis family transcriptional regulator [Deltaproteobacteria bacterium]|nr:MAG: sigma-54-dependent Fis family transcriptional regulator [Deltaproteobacteria bacterium]